LWGTGAFVTAQQVADRIAATAERVPGTGVTWQHGRVDAAAALADLGALTWYFAEGYTGTGFDEYQTLFNPNAATAAVTITYYLSGAPPVTRTLTVAPISRRTVAVHDPALCVGRGQAVAAQVASTNSVGLVVERPMYFARAGGDGGHTTLGWPDPPA
jgi:hypothetical protein